MRLPCRSVCVAIAFLTALTVVAKPPDPSKLPKKNGKPIYYVESFPVAPGTLTEMYDSADAVVDVRILSSEGKLVLGDRPRTFYNATVLRSLKGDLNPRSPVVFSQGAGEVELPDRIVQASDQHTLAIGERYIIFIRQHEAYGGYILVCGRETAFKVSNGRVEPQGDGPVADEQRNVTERQFNDEIAMIARRAPRKP